MFSVHFLPPKRIRNGKETDKLFINLKITLIRKRFKCGKRGLKKEKKRKKLKNNAIESASNRLRIYGWFQMFQKKKEKNYLKNGPNKKEDMKRKRPVQFVWIPSQKAKNKFWNAVIYFIKNVLTIGNQIVRFAVVKLDSYVAL